MRKYTVYEIEKLTNGRMTKYKLNQAIQKGELKAEEVKNVKKGKGVPKYFIFENNLQDFLNKVEADKKREILLPSEPETDIQGDKFKDVYLKIINQKDSVIDTQHEQISSLKERIHFLESQNNEILPYLQNQKKDDGRSQERRTLIMELANVSVFSVNKRKKILRDLNRLS